MACSQYKFDDKQYIFIIKLQKPWEITTFEKTNFVTFL